MYIYLLLRQLFGRAYSTSIIRVPQRAFARQTVYFTGFMEMRHNFISERRFNTVKLNSANAFSVSPRFEHTNDPAVVTYSATSNV